VIRWIPLGLGVLVLTLFILANPQAVALRLWPGGWEVQAAAWILALTAAAIGFVIGATIVWFAHLADRRRLAELERAARLISADYEVTRTEERPAPRAPGRSVVVS
jgi:uncharacterized integral membrane protein